MTYAIHPHTPCTATQNTQNEMMWWKYAQRRNPKRMLLFSILSILSTYFVGSYVPGRPFNLAVVGGINRWSSKILDRMSPPISMCANNGGGVST